MFNEKRMNCNDTLRKNVIFEAGFCMLFFRNGRKRNKIRQVLLLYAIFFRRICRLYDILFMSIF